ncbi:uncharacterized protein LY89DRAFT_786158 [Mollisia scopiformis]|uniref:Uncharacterized protein n=1 Tax=Mollisia scopiformis TaxID=149040 RepID=A0A194WWQ2_MOLSC|nr:uncharacterized protein LY89DRAFT_786158 [Mollisia scopiformis]KUJ12012.1 hypothetical protein LY89DRAFT_786158 [Mollisia scopiformis]
MCIDTIFTYDYCTKVEIRHRICTFFIDHTHRQLDCQPCPNLVQKFERYPNKRCECKVNGKRCIRRNLALENDGNHHWTFEADDRNGKWSKPDSPEKPRFMDQEEARVTPQKPAKKQKRGRFSDGDGEVDVGSGRLSRSRSLNNLLDLELDDDIPQGSDKQRSDRSSDGSPVNRKSKDVKIKEEPLSDEEMID